jgi:hypothetical protein
MRRRFAVAVQCALLICLAGNASASLLYGVDFPGATPLFQVNQSTGALAAIGATTFANIADLTSDPATGTLWGVDTSANLLVRINPDTGVASPAASIDTADPIVSIAFDPITRRLFGNTAVGFGSTSADALYEIDPFTGSARLKGTIGYSRIYALGFDQLGTLYGITDFSKQLIRVDTASGSGAAVTQINGVGLNASFDIASRPEDNTMFLADSTTNALYTLNTHDGVVTELGSYGRTANIVGLAFLMPAPEPSTYIALAAGLGLLALARRRRSR